MQTITKKLVFLIITAIVILILYNIFKDEIEIWQTTKIIDCKISDIAYLGIALVLYNKILND